MKYIQTKIDILTLLILVCAVTFGSLSYLEYEELNKLQSLVNLSFDSRQYLETLELDENKKEAATKLKLIKEAVGQDYRRVAFSDLIQAINSNNQDAFSSRKSTVLDYERRYFFQAKTQMDKKKDNLILYLTLAASLPLGLLIFLTVYIKISVFNPLSKLSQRMMDFLMDKYTFQFTDSPNNEIGNLQQTFHSLAQRVLNTMNDLKDLDNAKSEFVSITSHELRTPLTSIKGSLGLLSGGIVGNLDAESKKLISVAESETDRLIRLINDLLDIAKMESRSFTLKKKWIRADDLIATTIERLLGFAQSANVNLEMKKPDICYDILVDQDCIQQVITNLVSNAIKYSPKKDTVKVSFFIDEQKELIITVQDKGKGISLADQDAIFEKFRQASNPGNPLVKGTGLGLAISKALVEEHSGKIGVHSKLDEGATFHFSLPQWRLSQEAKDSSTAQQAA